MTVLSLMRLTGPIDIAPDGSPVWWTAAGRPITLKEMELRHLIRACQYVTRDSEWGRHFEAEITRRELDPLVHAHFKEMGDLDS